ncbi:MAG: YicC/YloC family endoribonuclease [Bacteroidales bacterium]|nr:YicC/YloC family endoribonuclease [Bacteroidales bacterium]
MKSMTGYAKQLCTAGENKYVIEIKTLNSKQLELSLKVPIALRDRELALRSMLGRLERGKVDCYVVQENKKGEQAINAQLIRDRYAALRQLVVEMGETVETKTLLRSVLGQGDVWQSTDESVLGDEEWAALANSMEVAIDECDTFRSHEGQVLMADLVKHVDAIEVRLKDIEPHEAERIESVRTRLKRDMAAMTADRGYDENRFEQEIIYYLEKFDITEEKVRLAKHIAYFRDTMTMSDANGKKLGFIAQEMGREINTIGSKANHVEIQRLVVEMKDELEKIKEQLANIL